MTVKCNTSLEYFNYDERNEAETVKVGERRLWKRANDKGSQIFLSVCIVVVLAILVLLYCGAVYVYVDELPCRTKIGECATHGTVEVIYQLQRLANIL